MGNHQSDCCCWFLRWGKGGGQEGISNKEGRGKEGWDLDMYICSLLCLAQNHSSAEPDKFSVVGGWRAKTTQRNP